MTQHDFAQLRDQFQQVIDQMPTQFTSHEFINVIAQQHQRLYIEALHTYRNSAAPFQTVHRILAQMLRDFVDYRGEVPSRDIWGTSNHCARWRRT